MRTPRATSETRVIDGFSPFAAPPVAAPPVVVRGAGSPLVFIPGLDGAMGAPAGISRWLGELEIAGLARGAQVWRIGRHPDLATESSMADISASYARTLAARFAVPIDVVGMSTGGSIALQLAVDHPELVRRLVLVSAAHRLGDHGRRTQRELGRLVGANRPRTASALLLSNVAVSAPARVALAAVGWLTPHLVIGRDARELSTLLAAEDAFDLTDRLATVVAPTLIIAGSRDRFYSASLYRQLADGIPDALVRMSRSGHLSLHARRRLAHEVLSFLAADGPGIVAT